MSTIIDAVSRDIPVHIYCLPEHGAAKQFAEVLGQANVMAAALMPDAHQGYSMPIGGVALVRDAVYPAWVGYDIGCGVCAVRLDVNIEEILEDGAEIRENIKLAVPTTKHGRGGTIPCASTLSAVGRSTVQTRSAYKQMGTLGGGNHFIEIDYDEDDMSVWAVIHSGSRGVGHGIAGHYMDEKDGMLYFRKGTSDYTEYMHDQAWCIEYALDNRVAMLENIEELTGIPVLWETLINKVHNVALETPAGVLHRKGATDASKDELGVIPGNCRDGSVIVKGTGNPNSLSSCSHGAGRVLGRGAAKRKLDVEKYKVDMKDIFSDANEGNLDESPDAYKDFAEVMDKQKELCTVVRTLRPLINYKG